MMIGLDATNGAKVGGASTGAVGDRVGDEGLIMLSRRGGEVGFLKKSMSSSWRRGESSWPSGNSSGCSSVVVALSSSSSSPGTTDSACSSFNQYIGSSSCINNSSNTLLLFSSTFLFASCANLSKNVVAFTGSLSSSSSKSARSGSSAGPTETKAPNSESELACFVWCLW